MDEFKTDGRLSMISGKDRSQLVLYGDHISNGTVDRPLYGVHASLDNAGNAPESESLQLVLRQWEYWP